MERTELLARIEELGAQISALQARIDGLEKSVSKVDAYIVRTAAAAANAQADQIEADARAAYAREYDKMCKGPRMHPIKRRGHEYALRETLRQRLSTAQMLRDSHAT